MIERFEYDKDTFNIMKRHIFSITKWDLFWQNLERDGQVPLAPLPRPLPPISLNSV